jgi:hypothetical protein
VFSHATGWCQRVVDIEETYGVLERTAFQGRVTGLLCHCCDDIDEGKESVPDASFCRTGRVKAGAGGDGDLGRV